MKAEILLVEDHPVQAEIFKTALQASGLPVVHKTRGDEALDYIRAHRPRLVVLDLHLPGLNGDKVVQALREIPQEERPILILATADPRLAEMVQEDAEIVLLKPISYVQLRDLVKRLLQGE